MTKDRLSELKFALETEDGKFEAEDEKSEETGKFMSAFFTKVNLIRMMLNLLAENVDQVQQVQNSILSQPGTTEETLQTELVRLMGKIKKISGQIHGKLKAMRQDIQDGERDDITPAQLRIKETQNNALTRNLVNIITKYNELQTEYRRKCKTRIKRQLRTAGKQVEDEEIEELIEGGTVHISLVLSEIVLENEDAKERLADIKARHGDIIRLEESIKKLHKLFTDVSWLIHNQGDMLDNIEKHVGQSKEWVGLAVERTRQARLAQRRVRKVGANSSKGT